MASFGRPAGRVRVQVGALRGPSPRYWRGVVRLLFAAAALAASGAPGRAAAQLQEGTPTFRYFNVIGGSFQQGEYRDALDGFVDEARGAVKTPQSRWIDSICYEAMIGECYYEMGQLAKALEHYTAAVKLYIAFSDWMLRVQFQPQIRPAGAGLLKPTPWGASAKRFRLGYYPDTTLISQGRINNMPQYQHGGVVQPATLYAIHVQEIVRATTLAIRRRTELLGPTCRHDPLTNELVTALSRRPGAPNHWSEAWIDVQLGLALAAAGRDAQAKDALLRSLLAAGEFYHPMTSIALVELGKMALAAGQYPIAADYFYEATFPAVYYPDASVLEEAFRYGTITHLMANRPGIYPPLAGAIDWARIKDLRQLHASLLILAAENHAMLGQTPAAAKLLDDARTVIGRRDMGRGRIGGSLNFTAATVFFQQKRVAEGDAALAAAMNYMRDGSLWLFHIAMADNLYVGGTLSPRVAMELYGELLRDPRAFDWHYSPIESLAVLTTPHPMPFEHWFEVALARKEHESALEIADLARRHRFFSSMPYGGRLLALRWVLEAPVEQLDPPAQLQRRDLLARYPAYAVLAQQAVEVRKSLAAMPPVAGDQETSRRQGELLAQLGSISAQQEVVLREMAVRRDPADLAFPPVRSHKQIQESMPEGHALLAFFATSRHMYAFLINKEKYTYWQIGAPAALVRDVGALLREMGQFQANSEMSLQDLVSTEWKKTAAGLLDSLLRGSQADFTQKFDELVIVPDGVLWYLPFEALQVSIEGQPRPLISRFRIRYAPTASLAMALSDRARNPAGHTAVMIGKLFPRDDPAVAQAAFDRLATAVPGAVAVRSAPAPSSLYAALFDRLIVFDDLSDTGQTPYGWSPLPLDRGKPLSSLADWLVLPFGSPDVVLLPGYHTAAEDSLKGVGRGAPGQEVFLSVCGLMASGTRTVLLSRWRTGGESSYRMLREFAQELPHTTPADAWQRAVFVTAGSAIDPEAEPRVKRTAAEQAIKASHPFFWAGYLLVDPGIAPFKAEPPGEASVVGEKPPGEAPEAPQGPGPDAQRPQPPDAEAAPNDPAAPVAPPVEPPRR